MNKSVHKKVIVLFSLVLFILTTIGFTYSNAAVTQCFTPKKILIISPHEDDETLACAGIIRKAVMDGNDVRVMFVTNGDAVNQAEMRAKESIKALAKLGLSKDKIYYLSYGDWCVLLELYSAKDNPTRVVNSLPGYSETYGFPGVIDDYHYTTTKTHASYCRANVLSDIQSVLENFRPDDIYMPAAFERHFDHKATALFTTEALLNIKKNSNYSPIIHEYAIYKYGLPQSNVEYNSLPVPYENADASMDFTSPYSWNTRESVIVPSDMNRLQTKSQKVNMVNAGAKYTADSPMTSQNDISKAFDGDNTTMYVSNTINADTVITVTFSSPQLIEKIETLFGDTTDNSIKTNFTLEAADNATDLNSKTKSYRLLAKDTVFEGCNWNRITTGDAYNCKVWKFTLRNMSNDSILRIPEITFYNANLKAVTIREYVSAGTGYDKYSMRDEIFWRREMSSLSYSATVSASSENTGIEQQLCSKVNDGIILGDGMFKNRIDPYTKDPTRTDDAYQNWPNRQFEWRTMGETSGAWVKLTWSKAITANRIVLYDRPDLDENILRGKLTFSDGTSVSVGTLNRNGGPTIIDFGTKTFTWVKFTIEQVEGTNTGLAEFEVYKK